jgi:hypothetical protein
MSNLDFSAHWANQMNSTMKRLSEITVASHDFDLTDTTIERYRDPTLGKRFRASVVSGGHHMSFSDIHNSSRFIISILSRYGIPVSTLDLFDSSEIIARVKEQIRAGIRQAATAMTVTTVDGCPVATSTGDILEIEDLIAITVAAGYNPDSWRYHNGTAIGYFSPKFGIGHTIRGATYANVIKVVVPVDGWGKASVTYGLAKVDDGKVSAIFISESEPFRKTISGGSKPKAGSKRASKSTKDDTPASVVARFLATMSVDDETNNALIERMELMYSSQASVYEWSVVRSNVPHLGMTEEKTNAFVSCLHGLSGDFARKYGILSTSSLSEQRSRSIPVNCRFFDLINVIGAAQAAGWIGDDHGSYKIGYLVKTALVTDPDLAGVCDNNVAASDFDGLLVEMLGAL